MEPQSMTVAELSRLSVYVSYGKSFEEYVSAVSLPDSKKAEAKEQWDALVADTAKMAPGTQVMIPAEWS